MRQIQLKRPDQIKAYLDKHVVGQEEAKRTLSVAVYNHYKRILHKDDPERGADAFVGLDGIVERRTGRDRERILTKPKNNLVSQYTELFREDGIVLSFEPEAISAAAQLATDVGTGARGLRSIMEKAMRDIMFSAPRAAFMNGKREIVVTREMILGAGRDASAKAS